MSFLSPKKQHCQSTDRKFNNQHKKNKSTGPAAFQPATQHSCWTSPSSVFLHAENTERSTVTVAVIYWIMFSPVLLSRPFLGLKTKTETLAITSRDQDRELGLHVSRPRPRPWPSRLETKTETWVFRSRDQDRDLGHQVSRPRLRPGQNELECTRVSRPWSRDHITGCINSNWWQSIRLKVLQITVIVLQA